MTRSGQNRPFKYGARDRKEYIVTNGEVAIRAQNDANGNALYIGRAKVGALTSAAVWQISFHAYDGNDALTSQTWAQNDEGNASAEYEFVYDDRTGLTYS